MKKLFSRGLSLGIAVAMIGAMFATMPFVFAAETPDSVAALIDALPNADSIAYGWHVSQFNATKAAFDSLTAEEQAQIDAEKLAKYEAVADRFAQAEAVKEDWDWDPDNQSSGGKGLMPTKSGNLATFAGTYLSATVASQAQYAVDGLEFTFSLGEVATPQYMLCFFGIATSGVNFTNGTPETDCYRLGWQIYGVSDTTNGLFPSYKVAGDGNLAEPNSYGDRVNLDYQVGGEILKARFVKNTEEERWDLILREFEDSTSTTPKATYTSSVPFTVVPANAFTNDKANVFGYMANNGAVVVPFTIGDIDEFTAVDRVEAMINALPAVDAVTQADKDAVDAAKAAYDALGEDDKAAVAAAAVEKLNALIEALTVIPAEELVINAINALPAAKDITIDDKAAVDAAKAAYDALDETQKAAVSADLKAKLDACVAKLATLDMGSVWVYDSDILAYENSTFTYDETSKLYDIYSAGGDIGGRTKQEYTVDRLKFTVQYKGFGRTGAQVRFGITDSTDKPNYAVNQKASTMLWEIYCLAASSSAPEENTYNTMVSIGLPDAALFEFGQYEKRETLSGDFSDTAFTVSIYQDDANSRWITLLEQYETLAAVDKEDPIFTHELFIPYSQLPSDAFSDGTAHIIFYGNNNPDTYHTMIGDFRQADEYVLDDPSVDVIEMIESLPEIADATLDDLDAIMEAKEAFDVLSDDDKANIDEALITKLNQLIEKMEELGSEVPGDEEPEDSENPGNNEVPNSGVATSTAMAIFIGSTAAFVAYKSKKRK